MTRKDFELIAEVIAWKKKETEGTVDGILESIARDFAHRLHGTNGRFDQERFMRACGF